MHRSLALLLASGCCFGNVPLGPERGASGSVADDRGTPIGGATIELCANDGGTGEISPAPATCARGVTAVDGTFSLRTAGWRTEGGYGFFSLIDPTTEQALVSIPLTVDPSSTADFVISVHLPPPSAAGHVEGVHVFDDGDARRVCTDRALTRCALRSRSSAGTRAWLSVDLPVTTSCATARADAEAACASVSDADRSTCMASHGIFLESASFTEIEIPTVDPSSTLTCAEGMAGGTTELDVVVQDDGDAVRVCASRALHGCRVVRRIPGEQTTWGPADVPATTSCDTQRSDTDRACAGASDLAACTSAHGVRRVADADPPEGSDTTGRTYQVECREGMAQGEFVSPPGASP